MYNIDYKEIGRRIRAERRKQDLTQEKLAELSDISESFMGHIERGGRTLSVETLAKLANALGLSVEYIIAGEHSYQPDTLPEDIHHALEQMNSSQRRVFLSMVKVLAANSEHWRI
jgi:transcriptional regulator with XRE-family HTH domain